MTTSVKVVVLFGIFITALLPRVLNLGAFLSPDEPRWLQNTLGFKEGLREHNLKELYQQPHPGITTMWLATPTIESDSWATRRLPQAMFLSLLVVLAAVLAIRLWGWKIGVLVGIFLALNPLFIAHSRVLAMDALLAIFLLLAVLALLVWAEDKGSKRWVILAATVSALAVLSKLSGLIIVPFTVGFFIWQGLWRPELWGEYVKALVWWIVAFVVTAVIVFPTFLTDPVFVFQQSHDFFGTELYNNAIHALGPSWYPEAALIWSTPLHWLGLVLLPLLFWASRHLKSQTIVLILFSALFFLAMQFSIKKGDRYLLPFFLILDTVTAISLVYGIRQLPKIVGAYSAITYRALRLVILLVLLWQIGQAVTLYPYYLAYRNPFFRAVAQGRTMGWGEGLDLAAEYLNQKSGAEKMLVIAYYEGPFSYRFKGEVTSAERLAKETPEKIGGNYVVLYRTMEGRAPDRWETKVLEQFAGKKPEHVVVLNGEEYAWVYRIDANHH